MNRYYKTLIETKVKLFQSYYKFDETSGDAIDSATNGLDGTLNGSITRDGSFYEFNADTSYVELPLNKSYEFRKGGGLVDFVMKANVVFYSTKRAWLISKRKTNIGTDRDFQFIYLSGSILFYIWQNPVDISTLSTPLSVVLNQEYIIGITCVENVLKIFINGQVLQTLNVGNEFFTEEQGSPSPVKIGSETFTQNQFLDGKMKKVFIQKGAGWTDQEILDNFNNNGIVTL